MVLNRKEAVCPLPRRLVTVGLSTVDYRGAMGLQSLPYALWPVLRPLLHLYRRLAHGTTTGVRAMVIDGAGRVFLVKHSYVPGWHLPGGGVDRGESVSTALARELVEEA